MAQSHRIGSVHLMIDRPGLDEVLKGPEGPVMHHLIRVGDKLIFLARAQLEPHRKTGRLQASLVKRFTVGATGPNLLVVAGAGLGDPNYAYWMHEGNAQEGSRIYPKKAKMLAWQGDGGHMIFRHSVKTFGGTKYLSDNLVEALATE